MNEKSNRFSFLTMEEVMKNRYRRFKRSWGMYYAFDSLTGNSKSLKTADKQEAQPLVNTMNEAEQKIGIQRC